MQRAKFKIVIFGLLGLFIVIVFGLTGGQAVNNISGNGQDIVEVALAEKGTVGGGKYRTWYTGTADGQPWCATFISWCAEQAEISPEVIPKFQDCDYGVSWFKKQELFTYTVNYGGSSSYTPQTGDIIFFAWGLNKNDSTHVGLVQFTEGEKVITIEGNTSNSVKSRKYLISDKRILGYASPLYPENTESDFSGESNSEIAWNFFIGKGCNSYAAAGILGNLQQESGIDPTRAQENGGVGRGIAQWTIGGTRYNGLISYSSTLGYEWTSLKAQLEYVWFELNGGDSTAYSILCKHYGGIENFKNAESIEWAVEAFEKSLERAGKPNISTRVQYAYAFYSAYYHLPEVSNEQE